MVLASRSMLFWESYMALGVPSDIYSSVHRKKARQVQKSDTSASSWNISGRSGRSRQFSRSQTRTCPRSMPSVRSSLTQSTSSAFGIVYGLSRSVLQFFGAARNIMTSGRLWKSLIGLTRNLFPLHRWKNATILWVIISTNRLVTNIIIHIGVPIRCPNSRSQFNTFSEWWTA